MALADELERRMVEFRSGRPPKDELPPLLWPRLLEALHGPSVAGLDLIYLTTECHKATAEPAIRAQLRRTVLDASLPRAVRSRFANLLATSEPEAESWLAVSDELPDEELTLAVEGRLAILYTLRMLGMEPGGDLAGLLRACVEDRFEELDAVLEPVRAAIGVEPSLVYRPVFDDEALRPFWPALAPALAAESSPEALAVLDLGLLRAPRSAEAEALRAARTALLQSMPAQRTRPPPQGELYLCPPDAEGHWLGLLALQRGSVHEIHPFDLLPGSHIDLRPSDKMPAQATRGLVTTVVFPAAIEVPFLEGLAFLRFFATSPRRGSPAQWAELDRALDAAPPLEPIPPGAPLSEAEIAALVDSGAAGAVDARPAPAPRAAAALDPARQRRAARRRRRAARAGVAAAGGRRAVALVDPPPRRGAQAGLPLSPPG